MTTTTSASAAERLHGQEDEAEQVVVVVANSTAAFANDSLEVEGEAAAKGYFYQVEQLTFLWVLFTLIVLGNSTVLVALCLSKGGRRRRKSRMNFFIKNLAAADLCVGLISVLTDIVWKITISWEAGVVACKVIRFSQAVVTYASTYVLVALSIDRYDAITHPMNFTGSWRRARCLVAASWGLSIAFSAPILLFYETTETEEYGTQCWIDFDKTWKWQLYMTLVSVTLFVMPALLISGCYIVIVVTIWSKGKDLRMPQANSSAIEVATNTSSSNGIGGGSSGSTCEVLIKRRKKRRNKKNKSSLSLTTTTSAELDSEAESRRASSRGLIPKAKVKTVKMTFVIIFVFILCWSPYIVFDLLQVYGCIPPTATNRAVATFIQSLAPLNSAANPVIYCLFSTRAGQSFCDFLSCCRQRKSGTSATSGSGPAVNGDQHRGGGGGGGDQHRGGRRGSRPPPVAVGAAAAAYVPAATGAAAAAAATAAAVARRDAAGRRGMFASHATAQNTRSTTLESSSSAMNSSSCFSNVSRVNICQPSKVVVGRRAPSWSIEHHPQPPEHNGDRTGGAGHGRLRRQQEVVVNDF